MVEQTTMMEDEMYYRLSLKIAENLLKQGMLTKQELESVKKELLDLYQPYLSLLLT